MQEAQGNQEKTEEIVMSERVVTLNGSRLTESEFLEEKKKLEAQPGVSVVETTPGVFKTRIQG